jgi:hypothetical protein
VSAACAAIAAIAAAYSARHHARAWRGGLQPDLALAFVNSDKGLLQLLVKNAGPGTAKAVQFMIVWEGQKAGGLVPLHAFLPADTGLTLTTAINAPPQHDLDPRAVVSCRGADGKFHAWDHDGRYKRISPRFHRRENSPKPSYRDALFERFFPDAGVRDLPLVGGTWRAGIRETIDPSSGPFSPDR